MPIISHTIKSPIGRVAAVLVVYLVVFTGLDFVAAEFEVAPGVSLWYPPAALNVVLLLLFGVRWAPALAVTAVIHSSLVARVGLDWKQVAILAVVTAVSFGVAAWFLTERLEVDPRLPTMRDVLWFELTMCLVAPIPMSVAQIWLLDSAGLLDSQGFVTGAAGFWAGAATGVGMLAPLTLVVARRWRRDDGFDPDLRADIRNDIGSGWGAIEAIGQMLALALSLGVAFAGENGSLDYSFVIYVPLIWISLRGGFIRAVAAVLAANIGAVALHGGRAPNDGDIALQFGLVSFTVLGLALGAAISQRKADAERNLRASLRDPLTGLANRTLLNDRMAQVMNRRPESDAGGDGQSNGALLLLDLDRFKQVNDGLGHGAGDDVLAEVAERLSAAVRDVDTVARLGGDEFAVLLDGISPGEIDDAIDRVLDSVKQSIVTDAGPVHVTISIGSVLIPSSASSTDDAAVTTIDQLMHHGDIALHRAKRQGRNRHVPFDGEMREQAIKLQSRETALRSALGHDEISVAYQPIVEMSSRTVVGAEALARWNPPNGDAVSATDLIAAAERSNQINRLGREVLRQACTEAAAWPDHLRLAVNVSAIELQQPGYARSVLSLLDDVGFDTDRLDLEITETQWIGEADPATRALTEAGIGLILDDFGTGYSSISYLHDMPITGIKIDRSFVATLETDSRSVGIVRAILCIADELGLTVTAEGVETEQHWNFLSDHGCTTVQGYLLGRPGAGVPTLD